MIERLIARLMRRQRHHTLIFHRVFQQPDPMHADEPDAEWFRRLIGMLKANFELIGLAEALDRVAAGALSGRTLSITFDDGYADNFEVALPILRQFDAPATFFVASRFIDGGRMWNDTIIESIRRLSDGRHEFDLPGGEVFELSDWNSRNRAAAALIAAWKHLPPVQRQAHVDALAARVGTLPTDLMMSSRQLCALSEAPGITIGGHTRSHPILASLPPEEARVEIEGGKADLESLLQRPVDLFAYPNGKREKDYRPEHAAMVRQAGFRAAFATDWGTLEATSDRFAIPRFTPWRRGLARFSVDLARCQYGLL